VDGLRELLAYELANGGQVSLINRLEPRNQRPHLVAKSHAAARDLHMQMQARSFIRNTSPSSGLAGSGDVRSQRTHPEARRPAAIADLSQTNRSPAGAAARTSFRVEQRFSGVTSNGDRFSLIAHFRKLGACINPHPPRTRRFPGGGRQALRTG